MKHVKLFENFQISEQEEPDCNYYKDKTGDAGYLNFWAEFSKMTDTQKSQKLETIKKMIQEVLASVKKDYKDWYSKPETIKKFSKSEDSVRLKLINLFIPNLRLKTHLSGTDKNIFGYFNPKVPELINVNLYNFFNGKPQGNVSVRDTIKHEMAHAIDSFFKRNGVRTYNATHPATLSREEYNTIYLINDKDQFARLNILRGVIGAGPADSGKQLLEKFMDAVESGKITSESFTFSKARTKEKEIYILVMTPKSDEGSKGNVSLDAAKQAYAHMNNRKAIMVDGKENINIEQLFSNFARVQDDKILVNMNDISSLNITSKSL